MSKIETLEEIVRSYQKSGESGCVSIGDHVQMVMESCEYDKLPEGEVLDAVVTELEEIAMLAKAMQSEIQKMAGAK